MNLTTHSLQHFVMDGKHLLHGSPFHCNEIKPHYTDGEVAFCATPYPQIASFMAVVGNCKPGNHGYTVGIHKQKGRVKCYAEFEICNRMLATLLATEPVGFIYVLDAEGFQKVTIFEHRAYESRYFMKKIPVTKKDLPFIPVSGQTTYRVPLNPLLSVVFN